MQGMSLPLGMTRRDVRDEQPFFTEFALTDAGVWLVLLGAVATLAVLAPAEIGPKADPLKPAPEGIKPEWYFLFMFETLKHVSEGLGVALFTVLGLFLLLVPFLDSKASRETKSPGFTLIFVILMIYVVVFQVVAVLAPGVEHSAVEAYDLSQAETYDFPKNLASLALLWAAIGFLVYYLQQLRKANTTIRKLRQNP